MTTCLNVFPGQGCLVANAMSVPSFQPFPKLNEHSLINMAQETIQKDKPMLAL
jgi:hypothetical protein